MTNNELQKEIDYIQEKLEALRPENVIDMNKVREKAEKERQVIRDLIEKESKPDKG